MDLLNYEDGRGRRPDNQSLGHDGAKLEVARNAALALWSCSKSTRSRFVTLLAIAFLDISFVRCDWLRPKPKQSKSRREY